MTLPHNNIVPDALASEPYFNILTKYLPTETEAQELNDYLHYSKADNRPTPRLVLRHPTIPRTRRMVTANKRIIDPFNPVEITSPGHICEGLAHLSRLAKTGNVTAHRVLMPLYWDLAKYFPLETASFLLSVPDIDSALRIRLKSKPGQRKEIIQTELQHAEGMFEAFLEFLYSLRQRNNAFDATHDWFRNSFARVYLLKEFSHHLSIINRYCGASC